MSKISKTMMMLESFLFIGVSVNFTAPTNDPSRPLTSKRHETLQRPSGASGEWATLMPLEMDVEDIQHRLGHREKPVPVGVTLRNSLDRLDDHLVESQGRRPEMGFERSEPKHAFQDTARDRVIGQFLATLLEKGKEGHAGIAAQLQRLPIEEPTKNCITSIQNHLVAHNEFLSCMT